LIAYPVGYLFSSAAPLATRNWRSADPSHLFAGQIGGLVLAVLGAVAVVLTRPAYPVGALDANLLGVAGTGATAGVVYIDLVHGVETGAAPYVVFGRVVLNAFLKTGDGIALSGMEFGCVTLRHEALVGIGLVVATALRQPVHVALFLDGNALAHIAVQSAVPHGELAVGARATLIAAETSLGFHAAHLVDTAPIKVDSVPPGRTRLGAGHNSFAIDALPAFLGTFIRGPWAIGIAVARILPLFLAHVVAAVGTHHESGHLGATLVFGAVAGHRNGSQSVAARRGVAPHPLVHALRHALLFRLETAQVVVRATGDLLFHPTGWALPVALSRREARASRVLALILGFVAIFGAVAMVFARATFAVAAFGAHVAWAVGALTASIPPYTIVYGGKSFTADSVLIHRLETFPLRDTGRAQFR